MEMPSPASIASERFLLSGRDVSLFSCKGWAQARWCRRPLFRPSRSHFSASAHGQRSNLEVAFASLFGVLFEVFVNDVAFVAARFLFF